MLRRKRTHRLKTASRISDSTRRYISRKVSRASLTKRRLKQIHMQLIDPIEFEDSE